MSNKAMAWAIDAPVKQTDKLVLMLLADCHNGQTGECFPKQETLASQAGISIRSVQRCLIRLEKEGLIDRSTERFGRGKGARTDFVLNLDNRGDNLSGLKLRGDTGDHLDATPASGVYKDKPEIEPEDISGNDAYERIWETWSTIGKRRSNAKKHLVAALNRLAKTYRLVDVIDGCERFAASTDGKFHPGLQVFLGTGKWENWVKLSDEGARREPTAEDWAHWRQHYLEFGEWLPGDEIPKPEDLK